MQRIILTGILFHHVSELLKSSVACSQFYSLYGKIHTVSSHEYKHQDIESLLSSGNRFLNE